MDILEKIRSVLTNPDKFFDSVKGEDIGHPVRYMLLLLLVPAALITIFSSFILGIIGLIFGSLFGSLAGIGTIFSIPAVLSVLGIFIGAIYYAASFVATLVTAAILHVIILMMGAKSGFTSTYKAVVYGSTPSTLFSWIPGLNFIFSIWSWYLTIKGVAKLQNMTERRAFFATIVPFLFLIIVAGIVLSSLSIASVFRS
jgi:hypothetical protein